MTDQKTAYPIENGRSTSRTGYFYFSILRFITPVLLIYSPRILSWLTHFNQTNRRLPRYEDRLEKSLCVLDEFDFDFESDVKFEEVNLVLRGTTERFINKNIPTFFVNPYVAVDNSFSDRYFMTSDRLIFEAYMGHASSSFHERFDQGSKEKYVYVMPHIKNFNEHQSRQRFYDIRSKYGRERDYLLMTASHRLNGGNIQIGSGILAVLTLLKISKKVNVYGWDSFIDRPLPASYLKQVFLLWSDFSYFHPGSRFSANLLNWIFASRLINQFTRARLRVFGAMAYVAELKWVGKYLYPIIYKE